MDWIQGVKKEDFNVTPSFLAYGNWVGVLVFFLDRGREKSFLTSRRQFKNMGLELRKEIFVGNTNLRVICIWW